MIVILTSEAKVRIIFVNLIQNETTVAEQVEMAIYVAKIEVKKQNDVNWTMKMKPRIVVPLLAIQIGLADQRNVH
jgi:hypothetical protein